MTEKVYKTSFIVVYVINKHGAAIVASYEGLTYSILLNFLTLTFNKKRLFLLKWNSKKLLIK